MTSMTSTQVASSATVRPGSKGLRLAASVACFALLATSAQAQYYVSFEESEGFQAGLAVGSQNPPIPGWAGSDAATANTQMPVTTAQARTGTQSLRANNSAASSWYATSPNLFGLGASSVSVWLKNPTTVWSPEAGQRVFTNFQVYYDDKVGTAGDGTRIYFYLRHGETEEDPLRLQIYRDGTPTAYYDFIGDIDLSEWGELRIDFDFTSPTPTLTASFAGVSIAGSYTLPAGTANENSHISYVRFQANTTGNGITYYDDLVVIPEPAHVAALVGALMLGVVAIRRRKA